MKRTPRVVIPPPRRSVEKMQNGSVLSPPPTGLPPKPSVAVSVGRGRTTERASPAACGGTRDSSSARATATAGDGGRRPASHLSGLRRSRCPAKCTGRGMAPHPQAASVSAETLLPASSGAASKGDQSPFEEPPALRGDERNHFRKVIDYEKRYQVQHAHGVRRP